MYKNLTPWQGCRIAWQSLSALTLGVLIGFFSLAVTPPVVRETVPPRSEQQPGRLYFRQVQLNPGENWMGKYALFLSKKTCMIPLTEGELNGWSRYVFTPRGSTGYVSERYPHVTLNGSELSLRMLVPVWGRDLVLTMRGELVRELVETPSGADDVQYRLALRQTSMGNAIIPQFEFLPSAIRPTHRLLRGLTNSESLAPIIRAWNSLDVVSVEGGQLLLLGRS